MKLPVFRDIARRALPLLVSCILVSRPGNAQDGSRANELSAPAAESPAPEPTPTPKSEAAPATHPAPEAAPPAAATAGANPAPRIRLVADLYDPRKDEELSDTTSRPAFKFTKKWFIGVGADASWAMLGDNALVGAELSVVPLVTEALFWFGGAGSYLWEPTHKLHRFLGGLEAGLGPVGLELDVVRFIGEDKKAWGGSGRLFLMIPVWYTRTEYSAACCQELREPLKGLRSCGCDRTLHGVYLTPYFRVEGGPEDPDPPAPTPLGRDRVVASFFGVAIKYGVAIR